MPDAAFIRLDPAPRARVRAKGGEAALDLVAVGVSPEALLVEGAEALAAGARVELSVETSDGTLSAGAIAEAAPGGRGRVLRFEGLDREAEDRLETFITRHRKADHIRICRDDDVDAVGVTTGFERYRLSHEALPEQSLSEVSLGVTVLGRRLAAPILISCMTGGSELAKSVNRRLAAAAARHGFALGLGSQRALLKAPELLDTYQVRDLAPETLLFGNVGAVQLNYGLTRADCDRLVQMVSADALVLHLNPLQEAVQPEGDVDFRGLRAKVAALAGAVPYPILLKEVGNGISKGLAEWAASTALAGVDVAGAGGTSWSKVESYRAGDDVLASVGRAFAGWGHPTAESLVWCRAALPEGVVIASGGVRDGLDAAKALALGADLVGLARPFLEAAARSEEALDALCRRLVLELRVALFCAGAGDVAALRRRGAERV